MSVESDDDRDLFFNVDEFGEEFTATSGTVVFNGIADEGFTDDDEVESNSFNIMCKFSDISSLSRGTTVTRSSDSTTYKIREIQPDGVGIVNLLVEAQ